jgi:hypothetical protein
MVKKDKKEVKKTSIIRVKRSKNKEVKNEKVKKTSIIRVKKVKKEDVNNNVKNNNVKNNNQSTYIRVKKDPVITPLSWVLPNNKRFITWINDTFLKYRVAQGNKKASNKKNNTIKLFPNQKFLRDYMQNSSPYHGVLLYHGLGAGKTCSSIAIAELLKTDRKIFVMLPASLKQNYIDELLKCGDPEYKNDIKKIEKTYTFISYNASNVVAKLKQLDGNKVNCFDDSVIVIDEVHNLVSMVAGQGKTGPAVYKKIMSARNVKLVCLSGTPLINTAYEAAMLFNLLRGYIEKNVFYIDNPVGTYENKLNDLYKDIIDTAEVDFVDEFKLGTNNLNIYFNIPSWKHTSYNDVKNRIITIGNKHGINLNFEDIKTNIERISLFPEDEDEFNSYFINNTGQNKLFINQDVFKRRILGLVSFIQNKNMKNYPSVSNINIIKVPMSNYQFDIYRILREYEKKGEKRSGPPVPGKPKSNTSAVRVYTRQTSNFVFPRHIIRPYPSVLMEQLKGQKKNNNNNNLLKNITNVDNATNKNMNLEINNSDDSVTITKKTQLKITKILKQLDDGALTYLRPGKNGLDKYSPKMNAMLTNIKKSKGIVVIYSQFRRLEGIEIFSRVLLANGYNKFNSNSRENTNTFAIYSGVEDLKEKNKMLKVIRHLDNKQGEQIKILFLSMAGAEGISLKNVREIHIMEPYWNDAKIEQVIGRGRRMDSHSDLPASENNLEIFRYNTTFTPEQKKNIRDKGNLSTDLYVYNLALNKKKIIDQILDIMQETAIDCTLNNYSNCYSFGTQSKKTDNPIDNLAFKPSIRDDLGYLKPGVETRSTKISLQRAIIDKETNNILIINTKSKTVQTMKGTKTKIPKKITIVYIDKNNKIVYDKTVQTTGNKLKIGTIDTSGKFVSN